MRGTVSVFFFLLDAFADDVADVGVAFFLFLDEGGIVEALVHLDFLFLRRAFGPRRRGLLLSLLFGLGFVE